MLCYSILYSRALLKINYQEMKIFKDILAPAYLGFALSYFANIPWDNSKFYAIIIPFYFLVKISNFNKDEE
jgi:hypothetical protein